MGGTSRKVKPLKLSHGTTHARSTARILQKLDSDDDDTNTVRHHTRQCESAVGVSAWESMHRGKCSTHNDGIPKHTPSSAADTRT